MARIFGSIECIVNHAQPKLCFAGAKAVSYALQHIIRMPTMGVRLRLSNGIRTKERSACSCEVVVGVCVGTIMDDDDDEALVLMGDADRIKLVQSKRVSTHPQDFSLVAYEVVPIAAERSLDCHRGIGRAASSPRLVVVISSKLLVLDHPEGARCQLLHKDQTYGFAR